MVTLGDGRTNCWSEDSYPDTQHYGRMTRNADDFDDPEEDGGDILGQIYDEYNVAA